MATVCWLATPAARADGRDDPILNAWLQAHEQLNTWSAEVVQTRRLAALTQPLVSTGRVEYCRPGNFRWELGQPAETIAIRSDHDLLLVYPGLKRAERYPLGDDAGGALKDALTLMEAGFPRDEASLRARYTIAAEPLDSSRCRISLKPRADSAMRLVRHVSLTFQTNRFTLTETEIVFSDGSTLRNRFTRSVSNQPLPVDCFSTNLPSDYKLVEPFEP